MKYQSNTTQLFYVNFFYCCTVLCLTDASLYIYVRVKHFGMANKKICSILWIPTYFFHHRSFRNQTLRERINWQLRHDLRQRYIPRNSDVHRTDTRGINQSALGKLSATLNAQNDIIGVRTLLGIPYSL